MDILELYHELIMDHGTNPRNCCKLENASCSAEGYNPLCGDRVEIFLKLDNDRIQSASFQGKGCAISTASASLLTECIPGKTKSEAERLFKTFQDHLLNHSSNSSDSSDSNSSSESSSESFSSNSKALELGKLSALSGVKAYPARVKCATLAWHAMQSALEK